MSDTAQKNICGTQRTYFTLQYKISLCNCNAFRPTIPIVPSTFKTDKNTVWQLLYKNGAIFLNLQNSECNTAQVDVKTSYLNGYTNQHLTHCNLINQDMSNNVQLHTIKSCNCLQRNSQNYGTATEILCELFIHSLKKQSDNLKFLSKDFKSLMQNENLSDVTLVTKQQEFKVHKVILSARSPVFNAMFHSQKKKINENKVVIKAVDGEVMNQVLVYIYTGTIDQHVVKNIAESVLVAADKYDLENLKFICGTVLSFNLTAENIFYNSSLAERYELHHLKNAIIQFITNSQDKIIANISEALNLNSPESSDEEENEVNLEQV